jgi:hypothetical protein
VKVVSFPQWNVAWHRTLVLPEAAHVEALSAQRGVQQALSRELNLAPRYLEVPSSCSGRGGGSPRPERFVSEDAKRAAGGEMALEVESVLDDGVNGQEALS